MRREKSLRIGVHHADGVVWGPVYRTHLRLRLIISSLSSLVAAEIVELEPGVLEPRVRDDAVHERRRIARRRERPARVHRLRARHRLALLRVEGPYERMSGWS